MNTLAAYLIVIAVRSFPPQLVTDKIIVLARAPG